MAIKSTKQKCDDAKGTLWTIATKIRGLSELMNMSKGEPPLSEEGLTGLAYLLEEISSEIVSVVDDD